MNPSTIAIQSLSLAMDGGFTAMADVSRAMASAHADSDYRLIGGVTVMLHVQRLGLTLPLRATADADFGVPPHVLRRPELVRAIEELGYTKVFGNRWERPLDSRRVAAVDLLVPSYRSRARDTVKVGDIVTTEVPGLAEAFRRPGITVSTSLRLTDGSRLEATIVLPDAIATLAMKTLVRSVRTEQRDAEDLWRCIEIAAAEGATPFDFDQSPMLRDLRIAVWNELGPNGAALGALTRDLTDVAAARLRTRLRALLNEVVGEPELKGRRAAEPI